MKDDTAYRALLKVKDDLAEAMSIDWEEVKGIGSHLYNMARQCIAYMALDDDYETEEASDYISELVELLPMLEEHQDDYVKVVRTPMGSWEISDAMEGEE